MLKLLKFLALVLVILLIIVLVRTLVVPSRQIARLPQTSEGVDAQKAAKELAGAIPFQTISYEGGGTAEQKTATHASFIEFHSYLEKTFPQEYAVLSHEMVGDNNLLFEWKGTDPALEPILLMGHQDVVPIEAGTENTWTHPGFSGEIADGFIWGRGTMDDKQTIVGVLEAVDLLLAKGFRPTRTIYLAFGQDEEIGGLQGAAMIAQLLKSRGVQLDFVLDEGGFISTGMVPGVSAPVAMIGTSEKGYLSLQLIMDGPGGHSSVPPSESNIGVLAEAIRKIEKNPMPAHMDGPMGEFLEYAGGSASFPMRVVFKNMWLFSPVVKHILESGPDTNATLRTTAAATIIEAGTKDNVMPSHARAVINFRLLPGDTVTSVTAYARRVINDPRVKLVPIEGEPPSEPSPQSSADSPSFKLMQKTIAQVYPEAIVAPFVFVGATDSKHYAALTRDTYRFAPLLMNPGDVPRFHGTNELVGVDNFAKSIDFYAQLMRNAAE